MRIQTRRAFSSCLSTLPYELRGSDVDELELLGALLHREAETTAVVGEGLEGRRLGIGRDHDERAHALTRARIGCRDHRDVGDRRVLVQRVLDLERGDVLRVADDDVLDAAGDGHVAVGVDDPEVAGAEPALVVERGGVERRVDVAEEALRTAQPELALLAGRTDPAVVGHDADLDAGDRGSGRRVEHVERRVELAVGGDRELGEAPRVGDAAHAEHLTGAAADLGRRGRAATR